MAQLIINTTSAQDAKLIARFGTLARARAAAIEMLQAWYISLDDSDFVAAQSAQRNINRDQLRDDWILS